MIEEQPPAQPENVPPMPPPATDVSAPARPLARSRGGCATRFLSALLVIVITTLSLAGAIVAEASLSFLGVGMGSDIMSWGNDINQAQNYLRTAPFTLIYPSIALFIAVFAFISLGELVRDALDPKARAQR